MLFDPWGHPLHGFGFMAQLLAILIIVVGLPMWASANFRSLSGWQLAIPPLWILYIVGLFLSIFTSDETLLYPRFGIDGGFLADVVISFAFVLMGFVLWSKE